MRPAHLSVVSAQTPEAMKQPSVELRGVSKHAVADQRTTVSVPPTLSEQQFQQNIAFELKFSQDVKDVAYRQAIDPRWLS